jgi:hypothetical protein
MRMYGLALAAVLFSSSTFAAIPVRGVAEGARLETQGAPKEIGLANGVEVRLASQSAGTFYSDHVVLEHGAVRVGNFGKFSVDARQIQIEAENAGSQAIIRLESQSVEVASIGGALKVTEGGALLTRVAAGTKMSFQQSGAAPEKHRLSQKKTLCLVIGITAAAALAIGLTAAAQGKSPF